MNLTKRQKNEAFILFLANSEMDICLGSKVGDLTQMMCLMD